MQFTRRHGCYFNPDGDGMRIDFSTLHTTEKYGLDQPDKNLPDGIYKCSQLGWDHYMVAPIGNKVIYIATFKMQAYPNYIYAETPYSICKPFPTGTVITFTQDSI